MTSTDRSDQATIPVSAAESCSPAGTEMMPEDKRRQAKQRLARLSGQVDGISRMIDDGRHCTDVLQQIAAVQKALDGVGTIVLRNYLERCVTNAIDNRDPLIYDELMKVFSRYR